MTRGQEMLIMDIGLPERINAAADLGEPIPDLLVILADEEELTAHGRQLEDIDKLSKGACVWKRLDAAA